MLQLHVTKRIAFPLIAATSMLLSSCQESESPPSLHAAFSDAFLIGGTLSNAMIADPNDPGYRIVKSHFNTLSPENCMKWGSLNPQPGQYELELADQFVNYGLENGKVLVGHVLFWHSDTPDWVFEDENGAQLSKAALLDRMTKHATLMAERWGDKIEYWDVVNESIEGDGSWRKSKYQQIIGDDFTEQAFRIASKVLPANAKLLYNDYSMTNAGRRDAVVAMVKDFKSKGIRIDGIGMQGHWGMDFPELNDLETAIEAFASTGVPVHITELDLDLLGRGQFFGADVDIEKLMSDPQNNPFPDGVLPSSEEHRFAVRYAEIFETLLKHADKIERVTFWGISDTSSWLNDFPVQGRTNFALLFDREYREKLAFYRVLETAKTHQN